MSRHFLRFAAALALAPAIASAQASPGKDGTFLIRGGTVVTGTGEKLANTSILVRNGRIAQLGQNVTAGNAQVIDATGKFVYPGMIDANTGIGLQEIGGVQTMTMRSEMGQFNPHIRAVVGLNVESEILGVTRMNGVTSVITTPTGGLISGQAALINTAGWTWEDLAVVREAGIVINLPGGGGRGRGGGGGGRGRGAAPDANASPELEKFMQDSKDYDAKRAAGMTNVDLVYESMRPLFAKKVPAIIGANSEQSIKDAIAFGEKWGIRVVIQGGGEAWKVRTLLAQKNIPVVLGSIESAPGDTQPYDEVYAQPGLLYEAGVKFAFSTGNGSNARHVPFHAQLAIAYGLPPEGALKALTIWPAEIFGADKDIGSIAQGKLANLVVMSGDPFDLRTQVTNLFIKGRLVPADDRQSRLYEKYKGRPGQVITP
jgi:hypothetical protein